MSSMIQQGIFVGVGLVLVIIGFKRNRDETFFTLGGMSMGIGLLLCTYTPS